MYCAFMKKFFLFSCFFFYSFHSFLIAQSVTMENLLNERLTFYVDNVKAYGNDMSLSNGDHHLTAKYSNGSVAAEKDVYFPERFHYTWTIKPIINIEVRRKEKIGTCTRGELFVNDQAFCRTLELLFDNDKNFASSIPVGNYKAELFYSDQHRRWTIALQNVKSNVYYKDENGDWKMRHVDRNLETRLEIHAAGGSNNYLVKAGNGSLDGCILVGNSIGECNIDNEDSKQKFQKLLDDYFDTDANGKPNRYSEVTVNIQLDYN